MVVPFTPPALNANAYNCPLCRAYAKQSWWNVLAGAPNNSVPIEGLRVAYCSHCSRFSVWLGGRMIHPDTSTAPPPNPDLNEDIRGDYDEARAILQRSPRGAAALLRLAIQKLCKDVGENGKNINSDIGSLVQKDFPIEVTMALDSVRVIGNEAVHPGLIDLRDDVETALKLFGLVNFIADRMISEGKRVAAIYQMLPPEKREEIDKRNAKRIEARSPKLIEGPPSKA
jgi:hypothetical protein